MNPILSFLAAEAGGKASGLLSSLFHPLTTTLEQGGHNAWPNTLPPPNALLDAWNKGLAGTNYQGTAQLLALHGIAWAPNGAVPGDFEALGKGWENARLSMLAFPEIGQLIDWYVRGWIPDETQLKRLLKRAGTNPEYWLRQLDYFRPRLAPIELREARNRGWVSGDDWQRIVTKWYGLHPSDRQAQDKLRQNIPGPADLIRFVIRDVFDERTAQALGLDQEFERNPDFPSWMAAQGFGKIEAQPEGFKAVAMDAAKAFWRAHWIQPSVGQGYTMLQRLRPTGGPAGGPRDPSGQVFLESSRDPTALTLEMLMRSTDISPPWRAKLAAVSYRPMGLRQARSAYALGILGQRGRWVNGQLQPGPAEHELSEVYQDQGHGKATADRMALSTAYQEHTKDISPLQKKVKGDADAAWRSGAIDDATYLALLAAVEIPATDAANWLKALKIEGATDTAKVAVSAIRKGFLSGAIEQRELNGLLVDANVTEEARGRFINKWIYELQGSRKELAASKVLDYVVRGLLDADEAYRRWTNLGYNFRAINLMLAQARMDIADKLDKLARREHADARRVTMEGRSDQAWERQMAEIQRATTAGTATKADVLRWFREGLITENDARYRLQLLKIRQDDIDRLIEENGNG